MGRSKQAWLKEGAGDLKEAVVEDVPVKGESVLVRALPAAYSNEAQNAATELKIVGTDQVITINKAKLEVLQWVHGVIDPVFSEEEARQVAENFGPSFRRVIDKIDELSAIDKDAIEEATARFPAGGEDEAGSDLAHANGSGSPESLVPARAGVGAGDADRGDV